MKIKKKLGGGAGGLGRARGIRVDVNEELKFLLKFKKMGGGVRGGSGGCDRRIEVFGKIHKTKIRGWGSVWGVRVGGSGWM